MNTLDKGADTNSTAAVAENADPSRTGAKVGAGVSVLTRGQSINIPAGTLLDFTLAAPFTP